MEMSVDQFGEASKNENAAMSEQAKVEAMAMRLSRQKIESLKKAL